MTGPAGATNASLTEDAPDESALLTVAEFDHPQEAIRLIESEARHRAFGTVASDAVSLDDRLDVTDEVDWRRLGS